MEKIGLRGRTHPTHHLDPPLVMSNSMVRGGFSIASGRGRQPSGLRQDMILPIFTKKPHEIKKIWSAGGAPLESTTDGCIQHSNQ